MGQAKSFLRAGEEPGRELIALGVAVTLTALALDHLMGSRIGLLFDLVFVTLSLALAVLVRAEDFFHVALMPPALMLGSMALVAAMSPSSIAGADDSFVQALVSGLVHHSPALLAGLAINLGWLAQRHSASQRD